MISQALLFPTLSPSLLSFKPSLVSVLKPHISIVDRHHKKLHERKVRHGTCRAELSSDTSIGVAIGASILYSLVFPIPPSPEDDEGDSAIDSADARFAVMGIISFIPYFNWLSWLFAWLDTGKRRYAVYALAYLAPYLRPNLSISPEDSWLPIVSIVLCIIHIQLEVSLKNGDIQGLQLFGEFGKRLSSNAQNKDRISKEESKNDHMKLPSAREQSRNFIRGFGVPRKPFQDPKNLETEDEEVDDKKKH